MNALLHHVEDLPGIAGVARPGLVHRLDKDTSGLLIVAKGDVAQLSLMAQLKALPASPHGVPPLAFFEQRVARRDAKKFQQHTTRCDYLLSFVLMFVTPFLSHSFCTYGTRAVDRAEFQMQRVRCVVVDGPAINCVCQSGSHRPNAAA